MLKRAFPIAVAALASPAILFGPPSAAQGPARQAWTHCALREDLPAGAQLTYQSTAPPGGAPTPDLTWSSAPAGPIHLKLLYLRTALSGVVPVRGQATYSLGSEPQPAGYKLVVDFKDAGQRATLPLAPGPGKSLTGSFGPGNRDLVQGFGRARRVTATVYEGDRQIAQTTFELAPDSREAGLDAFVRRAQANDPSLCRRNDPPLPVPPFPG